MAILFYDPRPVFLDAQGEQPLALGFVGFFDSGTVNLKAVYSDETGTIPIANPQPLGTDGRYTAANGVWLGQGSYRVIVYDAVGAVVWGPVDDIAGAFVPAVTGTGTLVSTMAQLRALVGGVTSAVTMLGYYGAGDGGGGLWRWNAASAEADDGGSVVQPNAGGVGRWKRIFGNEADIRMWGAVQGWTANSETYILRAQAFCLASDNVKNLVIPAGAYELGGALTFDGAYTLTIIDSAKFTAAAPQTVIVASDVIADVRTKGVVASTNITLTWQNEASVRPEWWGVTGVGGEATEWEKVESGYGGASVILSRSYAYSGNCGFGNLHFEPSGKLTCSAPLSFKTLTYEPRAATAWMLSSVGNQITTTLTELHAWWFNLGTPVDSAVVDMMMRTASAVRTRQATVVWDRIATYTFGAPLDYNRTITHKIENGTTLTIDGVASVTLQRVQAGPYKCFTRPTGGGSFIICQDTRLEWWGAGVGSAANGATNLSALVDAVNYSTGVDGAGSAFSDIPTTSAYYISGTEIPSSFIIKARNLMLCSLDGGQLVPKTSSRIELINCVINDGTISLNTNSQALVIASETKFGASITVKAEKLDLSDSTFLGNLDIVDYGAAGQTFASIKGCDIDGNMTITAVTSLSYIRAIVDANGIGGDLVCEGIRTSEITGNRVVGEINISSNSLLNSITGNNASTIELTDLLQSVVSSNTANLTLLMNGFIRCSVVGNYGASTQMGTTTTMTGCSISSNVAGTTPAIWVGTGCSVVGNVGELFSYAGFTSPSVVAGVNT